MIFYPLFGQIALAYIEPVVAVTWDVAFSSIYPDLVYSNGNLTVEQANLVTESCRTSTSKTAGKWYGEIHVDVNAASTSYAVIGVSSGVFTPGQQYGTGTHSAGVLAHNGDLYFNGSTSSYGNATATNSVLMTAIDIDANKIWFGKDGTWFASGNPAAGTNDAGVTMTGTGRYFGATPMNGAKLTGRFKAADFSYSPPSGFSAWES